MRLEHGRLVDDGPSHDVLDRYAGGGAGTGASWEGAPARIHALTLDPPRITSGEGFRVHLELEVLRAVEGLHVEFETRPRMPGIELAAGASARALHSELALEVGDRPGRWSLVAEVDALPTSAGAYECEVSLLERADAAPLGVTRARLDVLGPREAHPMVVLDARWTTEHHEGPVEERPGG
jgi:hypothetical protein